MYGKELILDLHRCDISTFNRKSLRVYFEKLCEAIDMTPCKLTFWDDKWTWLWKLIFFWDKSIKVADEEHTKGSSAVQFILTSNITIHTLDLLEAAYINVFSCKEFDEKVAEKITKEWFRASECSARIIKRI